LKVREVLVDCDADAILVRVSRSVLAYVTRDIGVCFFGDCRRTPTLRLIAEKTFDPARVYGAEKQS